MDGKDKFSQAKELARQGKRDEAWKTLRLYLDEYPDNVAAWLMYGDLSTNRDLALRYYNRALSLDPTNEIAKKNFKASKYRKIRFSLPENSICWIVVHCNSHGFHRRRNFIPNFPS